MMSDLKPLPRWRQAVAKVHSAWRRGRPARSKTYANLTIAGKKLLTLAISVVGAMLISYGVWMTYAPAGFVVGGILCWVLLWSHEKDKERK